METNETRIIVRDHDKCRLIDFKDVWDVSTIVAAVSADPRSFRELGLSWSRYRPDEPLSEQAWRDVSSESIDVGDSTSTDWLVIDLANQIVQAKDEEIVPNERAAFQREEGKDPEIPVIWINLPPNWQRVISKDTAPKLQPVQPPAEPVDFRGVLYGRAATEHFALKMLNMAANNELPSEFYTHDDLPWDLDRNDERRATANRWHELTVQVHADWLMTPREDLGGEIPRVFLHRGRDWAEWEEHSRTSEWSQFKRPPRALDRDTHTYQYGPMALAEVVVYFDFCREVIPAGWRILHEDPTCRDNSKRFADMMFDFGQQWLKHGHIDGDSTPPAELIESSRRHMPRLADGTHLDCDCPICRMMAEDHEVFYPTFSSFDGHHLELDDEFAFSLCTTREEWEVEQGEYRRLNEQFEREQAERRAGGEDDTESVWSSSYVSPSLTGVSTMTLTFRLSEIIADLQASDTGQSHVTALNEIFDMARRAPPNVEDRRLAVEGMKLAVERAVKDCPALTSKAADFQSQLDEWLRQPLLHDEDIPF